MTSVEIKANAKINLCLDVIGKRKDGYHEIKSVFQSVSICDVLTVKKIESDNPKVIITSNNKYVPKDERNIVCKAYNKFFEKTRTKKFGVSVNIEKHIPMQAGMGGGSADAAGMLVALKLLSDLCLENRLLCQIGEEVGADVPFCIQGGTCIVEGIGEKLEPINDIKDLFFVVIKPDTNISTRMAYEKIDKHGINNSIRIDTLCEKIKNGKLKECYSELYNIFWETEKNNYDINNSMLCLNVLGSKKSVMTGSGSAVFGIFEDLKTAENTVIKLEKAKCNNGVLATPENKGVEILKIIE